MATYNGHNEDASGNILLSIGNGMTATLETGTTASQAYTKGAYLYYNNRLCKVTAAIASGNTLTIGTNIAYTSLGAELTSHLKATNGDEFYFDYKDGEPGYYPSASKTASQFVPLGGTMQSTLLWSNPNPTSNISGGLTVSLSSGISNFDALRIYYKHSTTSTDENYVDYIRPFVEQSKSGVLGGPYMMLATNNTSASSYNVRVRGITYISDTQLYIRDCYAQNAQASSNSLCIVTKIYGLK